MKSKNPDMPQEEKLTISIEGTYKPVWYDALTGDIKTIPYTHQGNGTVIHHSMYEHDSLLLKLKGCERKNNELLLVNTLQALDVEETEIRIPDSVTVRLAEPNVVLLDMAEAKFDDGEWREKDEILRIDNKFRKLLGYPLRMESLAQPWINQKTEIIEHTICLHYTIMSRISDVAVNLGLEHCSDCAVTFNGNSVSGVKVGWYVDRDIDVIELGSLMEGRNTIEVTMPFFAGQNVEAMYLLGDFGVRISGCTAVIEEPVRSLNFGDSSVQGLPFYGGNVEYEVPITVTQQGELTIQANYFRSPVIKVEMDGEIKGLIAFAPYKLSLGHIEKGTSYTKNYCVRKSNEYLWSPASM